MIIQWVVVYRSEQNGHRRDERACALYLCYAHPLLACGFTCYGPSAFYLAEVEQNTFSRR